MWYLFLDKVYNNLFVDLFVLVGKMCFKEDLNIGLLYMYKYCLNFFILLILMI